MAIVADAPKIIRQSRCFAEQLTQTTPILINDSKCYQNSWSKENLHPTALQQSTPIGGGTYYNSLIQIPFRR